MKRLLLFSVTAILSLQSFALSSFPPDMLAGKTFAQRYFYLDLIYDKFLPVEDSIRFFSRAEEIRQLGKETNDRELELEADLMKLNYNLYHHSSDPERCVNLIKHTLNIARREDNSILLARVHALAAGYYWDKAKNYEKAFEHYHSEYELIKNKSTDEYPAKQKSLYFLGNSYWFFRDYQNAIRYMTEAYNTDVYGQSLYFTLQSTNTVGLCYQQLGNLDSADYFFQRANAIAVTVGNDAWDGITSGNLGYDYYLRGKYDNALPLLQKDLEKSVQRKDWGSASGSMIILAELNLKKGNIKLSSEQAEQAREWVQLTAEYGRLKTLYPLLSKLQEKQGNSKVAALYLDSAAMVKENLESKFAALQVLRTQQKVALQKEHEAEAGKELFTTIALDLVAVIVLSILIFIVAQHIHRLKHGLISSE